MDAHLLYTHQTTQQPRQPSMSLAGSHSAFFYGTLMDPDVLHRVCHGPRLPNSTTSNTLTTRPALLPAHRRRRVRHADYPAVTPNPDSTVCGTLVVGLTDGDMWRLDLFEGGEYSRRPVKVRPIISGDMDNPWAEADLELGPEVEAETYIWCAPEMDLEDREWDFAEFVALKKVRWVGAGGETGGEYNEVDEAVKAAKADDPTRGRGLNGSISKALGE
ncbi:hypothetical protein EJ06DRAFT_528011 [Trichodelitschia bisporula]|uniref:Putative gamma-glutamylcyclotransferase n=1 Tax=Trichodelitschia bisporula TaxID=703511 RepID=A0A6G1I4J8_9PEZI|nr:hypothetical protein EJ06DRAFT_528011 [Trichodelitschia bisporula]